MQVFKLYFKLLKGEAVALSIYAFVFVGLLFMQSTYQTQNTVGFQQEKIDTAIVNYNEDSPFVQGFMKYLGEYCNFVDLGAKESDLNDALFFRKVEYILTVPYDFGEDFLAGKNPSVEKKTVPDAIYSATVDQAINNYFNTARVYMNSIPDITEEELVSYVSNDLKKEAFVKIDSKVAVGKDYSFYKYYFNSAAYILLTGCLLGISMIMLTFHNINIRRRNLVAPITFKNLNFQLIEGNLIFVLGYDLFLMVFGYLFNPDKVVNGNVLLFWLNTIAFSISALSISYLAATLVRSKQANAALSYVLPLGLSFISGAFVPQFLLGDTVLRIASFTPLYWFVKANDTIAGLSILNLDNVKPIFFHMLIQLGFAAAIFALSLVLSKNRMQKEY